MEVLKNIFNVFHRKRLQKFLITILNNDKIVNICSHKILMFWRFRFLGWGWDMFLFDWIPIKFCGVNFCMVQFSNFIVIKLNLQGLQVSFVIEFNIGCFSIYVNVLDWESFKDLFDFFNCCWLRNWWDWDCIWIHWKQIIFQWLLFNIYTLIKILISFNWKLLILWF